MSFLKPDPPQPPDPIRTAAGATATNVGTAVANQQMNNINQITPQGALTYSQTGTFNWTDPTTGSTYNIPLTTATQSLSPDQQNLQSLGMQSQTNLAGLASQQSGQLQNMLATPFSPAWNTPGAGGMDWLWSTPQAQTGYADVGGQQRSLGNYGQQQGAFGDAGDITRTYGPSDNFSADRSRVEEALYGRIDPKLQQDRQALETRLQDQGIRYGSTAYNQAMDDWNRQSTDARLAVTAAGGQEQQRMMEMAAQRAGFQNAAQQQAYTQALGRGTFANQAQAQQFQEMLNAGTFANQAQTQDYQQAALRAQFANSAAAQNMARMQMLYGAQNQQRAQSLAEQYAQRNQPINEISALMSGSQVKDPSFVPTGNQQIATTDYAGLVNNRFNQDMQNYQTQSNNANQLIGGLFGAIAGAGRGVASDRRVKEDIDKVGTIFAAGPDDAKELPIYEYKYKGKFDDGQRHVGPMAQDVEQIDKEAVFTKKGVKHIKPTKLGSILKVA